MFHNLNPHIPYKTVNWTFVEMKIQFGHILLWSQQVLFLVVGADRAPCKC